MQLNQANTQNLASNFDPFLSGSYFKPSHGDRFIRVNISRNTLLAIVFSLLLHALILLIALPKIELDQAPAPPTTAMVVNLVAPPQAATVVVEEMPAEAPVKPAKKPVVKIEKPKIIARQPVSPQKPSLPVPDVITTPEPSPNLQLPKTPEVKDAAVAPPITDMQSYVKAMQARRNVVEANAAKQNAEAVARERGPTEAQLRDERIKRNFQNGTNGIFEITSLGGRNATFAFRGWTNDFSISKRQFYEVEAQPGQDVRLVMIRRMIALIREHYQGDFNWESHRLGRSVVQSARLEDSAGLEDFLMMEFFGTNYKTTS